MLVPAPAFLRLRSCACVPAPAFPRLRSCASAFVHLLASAPQDTFSHTLIMSDFGYGGGGWGAYAFACASPVPFCAVMWRVFNNINVRR